MSQELTDQDLARRRNRKVFRMLECDFERGKTPSTPLLLIVSLGQKSLLTVYTNTTAFFFIVSIPLKSSKQIFLKFGGYG